MRTEGTDPELVLATGDAKRGLVYIAKPSARYFLHLCPHLTNRRDRETHDTTLLMGEAGVAHLESPLMIM